MRQEAPDPTELFDLVEHLQYRPGWKFELRDITRDVVDGKAVGGGLTLDIITHGYNSYYIDRGQTYDVHHYMIVPAATYDRRSWQRWLFEQLLLVERHEACEFFRFITKGIFVKIDGSKSSEYVERPYAPSHGPGNDPYIVREIDTPLDQKTSFRGTVNE